MNFIINALLVVVLWIIPLVVSGCILDQRMPDVKKNENTITTFCFIAIQVVLSFLLFEGIESAIRFTNKNLISGIKMPEIVSGALVIGTIQANTQKTLSKRIAKIYNQLKNL